MHKTEINSELVNNPFNEQYQQKRVNHLPSKVQAKKYLDFLFTSLKMFISVTLSGEFTGFCGEEVVYYS